MLVISHRGARGLAPDNTISGIEAALKCHVDEVEIDVRVTSDLVPILSHDDVLIGRGKRVVIAHATLDDVWAARPDVPTLAEALAAIHPHAVAHIEIKRGEPIEPVAEVIRDCLTSGSYTLDSIVLASKSQHVLRRLHKELPELGLVVIDSWSGVRARLRAHQVGTKRISMRASWLWPGFLHAMQRGGYQLTPYTMNDPGKVQKWRKYIYGVVTDYPDRIKSK